MNIIWSKILEILKKIFTNTKLLMAVVIALLIAGLLLGYNKYKKVLASYDESVQNNKAYAAQLDNEKAKSNVFQVTIDQLEYYNDSITRKLIETKKELGIKDKELEQLDYIGSTFQKTDTLLIVDTIFKDPDFKLDTMVGDKWVNTHLVLEYPNVVELTPTVKSEKTVVVYSHRETIEPPKKFFLLRWFQKKHTVTKVIVDEKNPYMEEQENVFFNISK